LEIEIEDMKGRHLSKMPGVASAVWTNTSLADSTVAPVLEHGGANLSVMRSGLPEDAANSRVREIAARPGAATVASIPVN
jgi:hypothetical protein